MIEKDGWQMQIEIKDKTPDINLDNVRIVMNQNSPYVPVEMDYKEIFDNIINIVNSSPEKPRDVVVRLPVPIEYNTKKNKMRFQDIRKAPLGIIDKTKFEFQPRATGIFNAMELALFLAKELDNKERDAKNGI
jgi:hypothetical protein